MDSNLKSYKLGKRVCYLKHMQTKLQKVSSSAFIEYLGRELDDLDQNYSMGKEKDNDFFEKQINFYGDKMLGESLD